MSIQLTSRFVNNLADTFNAELSLDKDKQIKPLSGNAWNKLVSVDLTSQTKMAVSIRNRPRGLMTLVGSPLEGVKASPMPSEDYLLNKRFFLKAKHEINVSDILKRAGQRLVNNPTDTSFLASILNDKAYTQILQEEINVAITSLTTKAYNQIGKIAGDALNGSVTLTGDDGLPLTINFSRVVSATASPLWSDSANADPIANLETVNNELRAAANNHGNDLRFGTTLMSQQVFSALTRSTKLQDIFKSAILSPYLLKVSDFNGFFADTESPTFGNVAIDNNTNYINDSGTVTPFLATNTIYSASQTEIINFGGIPPAPINVQIAPVDLTGGPIGSIISNNQTGFTIQLIEVLPRESGEQTKWQIVATGHIVLSQLKPFVAKQVLA